MGQLSSVLLNIRSDGAIVVASDVQSMSRMLVMLPWLCLCARYFDLCVPRHNPMLHRPRVRIVHLRLSMTMRGWSV